MVSSINIGSLQKNFDDINHLNEEPLLDDGQMNFIENSLKGKIIQIDTPRRGDFKRRDNKDHKDHQRRDSERPRRNNDKNKDNEKNHLKKLKWFMIVIKKS